MERMVELAVYSVVTGSNVVQSVTYPDLTLIVLFSDSRQISW